MKGLPTAVLFDLDSTLADTAQRQHLSPLRNVNTTWEDYALACIDDGLIEGTAKAAELHHRTHEIHICSNRPDIARKETLRWLRKMAVCYDYLSLAPTAPPLRSMKEAATWNADRKIAYIHELGNAGTEVVLFYEDWPEVAERITGRTGIPVVLVGGIPGGGDSR